jgi:hypothetical protein
MSLTLVRSYFRARCVAKGLVEHPDAFNIDNIGSTIIDGSFHVGFFSANGLKLNQNDQEIEASVEVVFYTKGYRTPSDALDKAILKAEDLIKECEKPSNRIGSGIKNVFLNNIVFEPIADSNDNAIRTRISFSIITILEV